MHILAEFSALMRPIMFFLVVLIHLTWEIDVCVVLLSAFFLKLFFTLIFLLQDSEQMNFVIV